MSDHEVDVEITLNLDRFSLRVSRLAKRIPLKAGVVTWRFKAVRNEQEEPLPLDLVPMVYFDIIESAEDKTFFGPFQSL